MKLIPNNMLTLIENVCTYAEQSLIEFAINDFNDNSEVLSAKMISALSKGLEDSVREAARKGLEQFLQGFEEEIPKTIPFQDQAWRRATIEGKDILTKFGEIHLKRGLYYPEKEPNPVPKKPLGKAWVPLDSAWGMEGRNATAEVVEGLLYLSASHGAKEATKSYNKISGLDVGVTRVYQIIQNDGQRFKNYVDENREERWSSIEVPERTEAFVVSMDGANVGLREAGTKRGRTKKRPETEAETASEESKQSCYKNAMVGSYSFYTNEETSDHSGETRMSPVRLSSIYTAKMPEEKFLTFKEENQEVIQIIRGEILEDKGMVKLLIMDGARPLWKYAKDSKLFEDFDWLLDFYHASEHLSTLSEAIFGSDTAAAKSWYCKWRKKLKGEEGAIKGLLHSIGYYGKKQRLRGSRKQTWEREKGFFTRNQAIMNYAIYYEEGLPIGSGPVEAACKSIVKARMCQSGMRWHRESGANVLNLRVIKQSDQWEQMWSQYRENAWNLRPAA
jgi:hypothetical protein